MKYIQQLTIIMSVSFAGEILSNIIPFNMPAGVYGILIMFAALASGVLPLDRVEKTADFMLLIMPLLFVPAGVRLITVWDSLKNELIAIVFITAVSTIAVMAVTGLAAQAVINMKNRKDKRND